MGRLDDIIARNQPKKSYGGGLIGAIIAETQDPAATADDRARRRLAMAIVGGVVLAIAIVVALVV
jgi:hypothetical protein